MSLAQVVKKSMIAKKPPKTSTVTTHLIYKKEPHIKWIYEKIAQKYKTFTDTKEELKNKVTWLH